MPTKHISLGTGSNPARFGHFGAARYTNCYLQEEGESAKYPYVAYPCDGLADFATLTNGGQTRNMRVLGNELLTVSGRILFSTDQSGTSIAKGGLPSDGTVTSARNRVSPNPQIAYICDGLYYVYQGGVLSKISDPDLPAAISVDEIDGLFVFFLPDGRWFASDIDSLQVGGLDTARAESSADAGVRNIRRGRDMVFLGAETVEFWQNVGGDPVSLARTTSIDRGCMATGAVAYVDETIAWVTDDGEVVVLDGYTPQRISNHYIERLIEDETDKSALHATSWAARGHTFWSLRGTNFTVCWDKSTGQWHDRTSQNASRWKVSEVIKFGDRLIAGDGDTGKLYTMSRNTHTEGTDDLIMSVTLPPVTAPPNHVIHHELSCDVVTGTAAVTGGEDVTDPKLMLSYSDDGYIFGNERMISMGAAGQRETQVEARRLGRARTRSYRLAMSAAVGRGIGGVHLTYEAANA